MDITRPSPLLGGLAPGVFMRRHWQKKPLLIRAAVPMTAAPLIGRAQLFELAAREEVESRLIRRGGGSAVGGAGSRGASARVGAEGALATAGWTLRHGPVPRRALPPQRVPGWTLLVQGVDLHLPAAHELLSRFRFLPDARLDDLMVSYASDGGGVGPHVDSYDVFLLQLQGRRRWQVARRHDPALLPDVPLKILANFQAETSWLLDAGDMLYLPPGWAHDGVAQGECLTASIGFRAPARSELGREILQRALDAEDPAQRGPLYRDPTQPATGEPARIPAALHTFGADAVARFLRDPASLACALGEVLSEPKPGVWFDPPALRADGAGAVDATRLPGAGSDGSGDDAIARSGASARAAATTTATGLRLDPRTRMLYDDRYLFINGESFRAAGRDARLMRSLADQRWLGPGEQAALSTDARALVELWLQAGWLRRDADQAPATR